VSLIVKGFARKNCITDAQPLQDAQTLFRNEKAVTLDAGDTHSAAYFQNTFSLPGWLCNPEFDHVHGTSLGYLRRQVNSRRAGLQGLLTCHEQLSVKDLVKASACRSRETCVADDESAGAFDDGE